MTIRTRKKEQESKRILLDVSTDLFYSESSIRHLERIVGDIKFEKAHFSKRDLLEDED